jgi:hypothetical protein
MVLFYVWVFAFGPLYFDGKSNIIANGNEVDSLEIARPLPLL